MSNVLPWHLLIWMTMSWWLIFSATLLQLIQFHFNDLKKSKKIKIKIETKFKKSKTKTRYDYQWDLSVLPPNILFIFDEAHKCKNHKTNNGRTQ